MNYRVESDFEHKNLRCVVVMTNRGHRCGYVGIPKSHPLHGIDYSAPTIILRDRSKIEIILEQLGFSFILNFIFKIINKNKAKSPESFFDVHGGITYCGGDLFPVESDDLWWYGYDCAHYGDLQDFKEMDDKILRGHYENLQNQFPIDGIIRSLEYCIEECKLLAEQLN